ncbi:MAG: ROK family protein [Pirellulales bacterium]|nr:ROK family protein [Pirellulales bacterium]
MLHNPLDSTTGIGDVTVAVNPPAATSRAKSKKKKSVANEARPPRKKRKGAKRSARSDRDEEEDDSDQESIAVKGEQKERASADKSESKEAAAEDDQSEDNEDHLAPPSKILVLDIGGTKLKALATGHTEPRKMTSGKRLTPAKMVKAVQELAVGWEYEAISIGFPGLVGENGPRSEPGNLASGWVGFDFTAAFGMPVRIINDASMQALGSYEGGRMLFLGLGTGLGSALIANNVLINLELGQLPYRDERNLGETLGRRGMTQLGKKDWRAAIAEIVPALMGAFAADYVVLGGGNSKEVKLLPPGARMGHNLTAFRGGFRLWHVDDVRTQWGDVSLPGASAASGEWRLV